MTSLLLTDKSKGTLHQALYGMEGLDCRKKHPAEPIVNSVTAGSNSFLLDKYKHPGTPANYCRFTPFYLIGISSTGSGFFSQSKYVG